LLLLSLEYAAYAALQEKQKRNEVKIRNVDRGTGFEDMFGTSYKYITA
jgi:hypothetical protein